MFNKKHYLDEKLTGFNDSVDDDLSIIWINGNMQTIVLDNVVIGGSIYPN